MENVLVYLRQLQPSGIQFETTVLFLDVGSSSPKRRQMLQMSVADQFASLLLSDPTQLFPAALFSQFGQVNIHGVSSSPSTGAVAPLPAGTYANYIDWLSPTVFDTATMVTEMPTPVPTTDMPNSATATPAPTTNDTASVEFEPTLVAVHFSISFFNGAMEDLVDIGPIYLHILSYAISSTEGAQTVVVMKQLYSYVSLPVFLCLYPFLLNHPETNKSVRLSLTLLMLLHCLQVFPCLWRK